MTQVRDVIVDSDERVGDGGFLALRRLRLRNQRADGSVSAEDMWETFNMGCGFCCVVPAAQADAVTALLGDHHPGAAVIGSVTAEGGLVELPLAGLAGRRGEGFRRT